MISFTIDVCSVTVNARFGLRIWYVWQRVFSLTHAHTVRMYIRQSQPHFDIFPTKFTYMEKKMKISSVYQSASGIVTMHLTCALQGSRTVKWRMYERWNRVITISILCCVRLICSYFHLAIILWLGSRVVWLNRGNFKAIKSLQRLMFCGCVTWQLTVTAQWEVFDEGVEMILKFFLHMNQLRKKFFANVEFILSLTQPEI